MKTTLAAIIAGLTLLAGVSRAQAIQVTLYNGTGLPGAQNPIWLQPRAIRNAGGFPAFVTPGETSTQVSGQGVQLNTAANSAEYSGYTNYEPISGTFFNSSFPTLDRNLGYTISFGVRLDSSTNTTANRSAFSITVTNSDGLSGIELGFEPGSVIGRNPDFTPGESVAFNTGTLANYTLAVQGNNYTLSSGAQTLTGALRSYNFNPLTSNPPLGTFNPYRIGNFLFFGDNTGQESGTFTLGAVSVNTDPAAVPYEFSPTLGILILGAWTTVHHLRNKKK